MLKSLLAACIAGTVCVAVGAASSGEIRTVGLYTWWDTPDQHAFWKACGVDTLQLSDLGWNRRADTLDSYYTKVASDLKSAKKAGFKVYVILFANISQWKGPEDREPTGIGVKFHPHDKAAMDDRLQYLAKTVNALREADGFTFFAGDPGGVPKDLGPADARDWMDMAIRVGDVVKREAPHAKYNINPWAVTMWQYPEISAMVSEWWLKETELTERVISEKGLIGPDRGVELAGHNYYRALALRNFSADGITPKPLPTAETVQALRARGTKRIWAWPYFLLDEADDGDVSAGGAIWGQTQIETRYIHRYVEQMRGIGVDGIIGNWSWQGYLPAALNTYAFGRFCHDVLATPEAVIDEYAGFVADDSTKAALGQILRYVENHSNWQAKLPESYRLPAFPCNIRSTSMALARLDKVHVRVDSTFPLPEPAADYLKRVRSRLEVLAARESSTAK